VTDQPRRGFTAIEMLVVITVMILLAGLSAIAVLPAVRRGKLSDAVNRIDRCVQDARQQARQRAPDPLRGSYGVRLVGDQVPNYAAVMLGNQEIARHEFNRNVQIYVGNQPLTTPLAWFNQPITGYVVGADGRLIDVGAARLGQPSHLSLRTLDGRHRTAIAVYRVGLLNSEEF